MHPAQMLSFDSELQKIAADLTEAARDKIKPKNFAEPKKRAYPIEDPAHARNALARVSQFGSPEEKAKVRAKVHAKYPGIGKESSSPDAETAKQLQKQFGAGWKKQFGFTSKTKKAYPDMCAEKSVGGDDSHSSWIKQFDGTPLAGHAVELEKALLQHDIENNQKQQADQARRDEDDKFRQKGDKIRNAKRSLELQLALHKVGGGAGKAKMSSVHETIKKGLKKLSNGYQG